MKKNYKAVPYALALPIPVEGHPWSASDLNKIFGSIETIKGLGEFFDKLESEGGVDVTDLTDEEHLAMITKDLGL